jgi:hypothetical protein
MKYKLSILTFCAVFLLVGVREIFAQTTNGAQVAAQTSAVRRFHVNKTTASIRNKPMGFTLGTLFETQAFDVQCRSRGGWGWGFAHGDVQFRGWIPLADLDATKKQRQKLTYCPSHSHVIDPGEFLSDKNSRTCSGAAGQNFKGESTCDGSETKIVDGTRYYRNFDYKTGKPSGSYTILNARTVYWRYITKRADPTLGQFVLLRLKQADTWGFVPKSKVKDFPKYTSCTKRHISCSK